MFGWITGLFVLLRSVPDFLKLAREIFSILHGVIDYFERRQKLQQLKDGLKDARETGDTSKLESLFK